MGDLREIKQEDNNYIESEFILDYVKFGLKMNFRAIIALFEQIKNNADFILRKSLCLSGMQLLFSSYEDFALLLHAFLKKKNDNIHIHLTLGNEQQSKKGSIFFPKIFKNYKSSRQMLDNFGFSSITFKSFQKKFQGISEQQLDDHFKNQADSIRQLGVYQESYNKLKNILKHGKAVFENDADRKYPDHIIYLNWEKSVKKPVLKINRFKVSFDEFKLSLIQTTKIYVYSSELLWLFTLQYHPEIADEFFNLMKLESIDSINKLKTLGIHSDGFTNIFYDGR